MAELGNHSPSPDMDYNVGFDGSVRGMLFTTTEASSGAASLWWYGTTGATVSVMAAVYEDGDEPDMISEQVSAYEPGELTEQWHEIPLGSTALSASTVYRFLIHDNGTGTPARMADNIGDETFITGDRDDYGNIFSGGVWITPAGANFPQGIDAGTARHQMYLEYTPDADGSVDSYLSMGGIIANP